MVDFVNLSIAILPFIFALIAVSLIPSKDKILNNEIEKYSAEVLIVVYMIALFILILGFYYFMSIFSDSNNSPLLNIFNGVFLEVIALGIMGVNYSNYSLFSEKVGGIETSIGDFGTESDRVTGEDAIDVTPVEVRAEPADSAQTTIATKATTTVAKPGTTLLRCPKCGNTISIGVSTRPVKIHCPHCGVEGIIN